jgi:hypothetical protein
MYTFYPLSSIPVKNKTNAPSYDSICKMLRTNGNKIWEAKCTYIYPRF